MYGISRIPGSYKRHYHVEVQLVTESGQNLAALTFDAHLFLKRARFVVRSPIRRFQPALNGVLVDR